MVSTVFYSEKLKLVKEGEKNNRPQIFATGIIDSVLLRDETTAPFHLHTELPLLDGEGEGKWKHMVR